MKLNEQDARAVDIVLDGQAGATDDRPGDGASAHAASAPVGYQQPPTPGSAVTPMNDDLAKRVTKADELLKLLDYLPAEEPSDDLVQRTLERVTRDRQGQARRPESAPSIGPGQFGSMAETYPLHRSPDAAGDEDAS